MGGRQEHVDRLMTPTNPIWLRNTAVQWLEEVKSGPRRGCQFSRLCAVAGSL